MAETLNDGLDHAMRLLEQDDRGVFGPEGLNGLSASVRRRFKTSLLPAKTRAFILVRAKKFDEAETLLRQSLPRNKSDDEDDRYFGIYCGLADIALAKNDRLAALDWFRQGIEKFPAAVRRNHLLQLSTLGIDTSRWIRSTRDDGLSESDSAAVLQQVLLTINALGKKSEAGVAENVVIAEFKHLETDGAGKVARSRVKNYIG